MRILLGVEARALGEEAHIGMDEGIDRIDRDGLAAQRARALFEWRLGVEARRKLLAQDDLHARTVERLHDREQPLSARRRARQRAAGGLREVGRAGDHRVHGADARNLYRLQPHAVLGPQV